MHDLLQSERVLGTPIRSSVPAASDMHGAAENMGTPDWLKDDTQDTPRGPVSEVPIVEEARGVVACADAPMPTSPQPQRCGSERPLIAPTDRLVSSQAPSPCRTDVLGLQRDAAAPATQSQRSDLAERRDTVPAGWATEHEPAPEPDTAPAGGATGQAPASGEAYASHPVLAESQEAAVPGSAGQKAEGVREPGAGTDVTLPIEPSSLGTGEQKTPAQKPAPKSKLNKELARLTLFHWDKLAGEHPVGVSI